MLVYRSAPDGYLHPSSGVDLLPLWFAGAPVSMAEAMDGRLLNCAFRIYMACAVQL